MESLICNQNRQIEAILTLLIENSGKVKYLRQKFLKILDSKFYSLICKCPPKKNLIMTWSSLSTIQVGLLWVEDYRIVSLHLLSDESIDRFVTLMAFVGGTFSSSSVSWAALSLSLPWSERKKNEWTIGGTWFSQWAAGLSHVVLQSARAQAQPHRLHKMQ